MTELKLQLTEQAMAALNEISVQYNTTYAEIIRRALGNERFFSQQRANGCKVLIEQPDGSQFEVYPIAPKD